jgi:hypothetical protein
MDLLQTHYDLKKAPQKAPGLFSRTTSWLVGFREKLSG